MPQDQDSKRYVDYSGPWQGIAGNLPPILLGKSALVQATNCTIKDGFLSSRPVFVNKYNNFTGGVESYAQLGSFITATGNLDVFAIGGNQFWHFSGGVWTSKGAISTLAQALGSYVTYRNLLYFGSASGGTFYTWDGTTLSTINNQVSGLHWGALADHIVVANGASNYSGLSSNIRGVWWSGSGNPQQFNPATDLTAGFNNLNVDLINGMVGNARNINLYHPRGIIEMAPTGNGQVPFTFNDVVYAAKHGIGLWYCNSLANWGMITCFMSKDDIYLWSPQTGLIPISGISYNNIFADIATHLAYTGNTAPFLSTSAQASTEIIGSIVPFLSHNYVYPLYVLAIPLSANTTSIWAYSIKQNTWENHIINGLINEPNYFTGRMNTINLDAVDEKCYVVGGGGGTLNVYRWDDTNTNCPVNNVQLRDEDTHGRFVTYDRIRLVIRDQGAVTVTFNITGFNEDGTTVTSSSIGANGLPGSVTFGGVNVGQDLQVLIDMQPITCLVPTLSFTIGASAGSFSFEQIEMIAAGMDAEPENI